MAPYRDGLRPFSGEQHPGSKIEVRNEEWFNSDNNLTSLYGLSWVTRSARACWRFARASR